MKTIYLLLFCLLMTTVIASSQVISSNLEDFKKIVIGPKIDLTLSHGNLPSIQIEYDNIEEHRINYEVVGKSLRIYLDDARYVERSVRWQDKRTYSEKMYKGVEVHAHVTFRQLEALDVRGEEVVAANDIIRAETFKLQLYGESMVTLKGVESNLFKANVYGDVVLHIEDGYSAEQIYRLYGDSEVRCENFQGGFVRTTSFGDSELTVYAEDLKITAFGDASIYYAGNPHIHKNIVIGDISVVRID
ncbi:MAG: DUF2807 domain-containing protein [Saprospiraceae bacterium]|nr:DUF2807 domain-containing protein [Saprospiraceae bacterium]